MALQPRQTSMSKHSMIVWPLSVGRQSQHVSGRWSSARGPGSNEGGRRNDVFRPSALGRFDPFVALVPPQNRRHAAPCADRPSSRNGGSLGLVQLDGRGGEPRESPGLFVLLFHTVA